MAKLELDNFEYSTNSIAQRAYVSDDPTNLQCYSESTIKTQGGYSLKVIANATSVNKSLFHSLSPASDLSGVKNLKIDMRSSRVGSNIKLGLLGSGGAATVTGGEAIQGSSVVCAGGSDYIDFGAVMQYQKDQPWSISIWTKITDASYAGKWLIFQLDGSNSGIGINLPSTSGIDLYISSVWGSDAILCRASTGLSNDGSKQNLVITYDGSGTGAGIKMYLNGIQLSTSVAWDGLTGVINYPGTLITGNVETSYDEFLIFNRELSQIEAAQIYNGGNGLPVDTSVAPYNSGLVNAYHMDEGTGTSIKDSIGGVVGTLHGSPTWGDDMVLQNPRTTKQISALNYGGTWQDWVKTTIPTLPIGNSARTVTAWFKASSVAHDHSTILSYGKPWAGNVITLLDIRDDGTLYTETGSGVNALHSPGSVLDGIPHLGGLTYDGTYLRMYLDGVCVATSDATSLVTEMGDFDIGDMDWASGYQFLGEIGQTCIWNRALSDSEMAIVFNGRKGVIGSPAIAPFNNGLVAGWNMDEGTGVNLADFSGNGFNTVITNPSSSITWGVGNLEKEIPLTQVDGAYTIHTFLTSGTITTSAKIDCEVLLVAGGAGGASGGGGAGGVLYSAHLTLPAGTYNITIGDGGEGGDGYTGSAVPTNGGDTVFFTLTAIGGGHGGYNFSNAQPIDGVAGGSGGGGAYYSGGLAAGGLGTSPQGNDGSSNSDAYHADYAYPAGAGGGWKEAGHEPLSSSVGGIGGAGDTHPLLGGLFVVGKGGDGTTYGAANNGKPGKPYTGNGSEGSGVGKHSGNGGSGMVVIKYLTPSTTVIAEITPEIVVADQWQTVKWYIGNIEDNVKNSIAGIKVTIEDDTESNTFYLDNFEVAQAIDLIGMIN